LVRYSAVSVIATATSLSTLGALVGLAGMSAVWANVVATGVGTVPSFELNRRWVWSQGGKSSLLRQVVPFCALSFIGLAISTVAVGLAGTFSDSWSRLDHTLAVESASIAAYGSLWVVQYQLLGRLLFRPSTTGPGSAAADTASDDDPAALRGDERHSGLPVAAFTAAPPVPVGTGRDRSGPAP
jgi:putative flippase GtrA